MTLTELQYIVAVAEERHFGKAAQKCFVSQPSLSVAVRKLEEGLDLQLFERGRNEVIPTAAGERVVAQARRILHEVRVLKDLAKYHRDPLHGPLRVGAIYTIGPYLFPELIPAIHEALPSMPLVVEENFTAVLAERLKQGEVDVILISLPFEHPDLVVQPLYDEPFVILLPVSHPLTQKKYLEITEVGRETVLLLGEGHCFRNQVLEICPECLKHGDAALQHALENSSLETIRYMVAGGVGITILPCTAAGAERYAQRLLTIRRFNDMQPARRGAMAWRKNFAREAAVERLREAILGCLLSCVHKIQA